MKIRKYIARNMPEALQQVRDDLGEQAVILNTRQIRRNTRFNAGDEARVEVTAALDERAPTAAPTAPTLRPPAGATHLAAQRYASQAAGSRRLAPMAAPELEPSGQKTRESAGGDVRRETPPLPPVPAGTGGEDMDRIMRQLRTMQDALARVERRSGASALVIPDALGRLGERLRNMGVAPVLVEEACAGVLRNLSGAALDDREAIGEWLSRFFCAKLPPCQHIRIGKRRKVIGFFGASGAGKTTAVAKIAAGFALKRKERIVLVTADDRRVGGLDQVRAFAHIIGVELESAYSEEDMAAAIERHPQAQLVLIDAPGCGPNDVYERERQHRIFEAAGAEEVHVVIDALSGLEHALDIVDASSVLGERRLLFTKVDEVARPGAMLSAVIESQLPTSYMTVGCQVPGDIEAGEMEKIVAQILGRAPERKA